MYWWVGGKSQVRDPAEPWEEWGTVGLSKSTSFLSSSCLSISFNHVYSFFLRSFCLGSKINWPGLTESPPHVPVYYSCVGSASPEHRDMVLPPATPGAAWERVEAVPRIQELGKGLNSVHALPAALFSFLPANCSFSSAGALSLLSRHVTVPPIGQINCTSCNISVYL